MDVKDWLAKNIIYVCVTGSHAYGTSTPESDFDYRGAAIPPRDYFFGMHNFEQADGKETAKLVIEGIKKPLPEDSDITIWSLKKMITLAAEGNPNMIELIFPPDDALVHVHPTMEKFFAIQEAFLSRLLKHRFSGYAMAQLKRIRNHYRWLHNPPDPPSREEYGLGKIRFPKDQTGAALRMIQLQVEEWLVDQTHLPEDIKIILGPDMIKMVNIVVEQLGLESNVTGLRDVMERAANMTLGFDSDFINYLQRYSAYKNHLADYGHYENWKKSRNPARAELEKKWGYDTKHAMHLVRLMRMAREILEKGQVIVRRPDADELNAVRNGAWKYDDLVEWAESEDKALNDVMEKSILPKQPNRKLIHEILTEETNRYLRAA